MWHFWEEARKGLCLHEEVAGGANLQLSLTILLSKDYF